MSNDFDFEAMFEQVSEQTETTIPEVESIIEPEVLENPNIKPVASVSPRTMSFNNTTPKPKSDKPQRRFITKEITIDKFNVKRVKLELTPSVCDICAFDVAAKRFGSYHNAPQNEHKTIIEAVLEHKKVAHPLNQSTIIEEDQLPKMWLGANYRT